MTNPAHMTDQTPVTDQTHMANASSNDTQAKPLKADAAGNVHLGTSGVRRFGFLVMALTFVVDQASKLWLLFGADIIQNGPFPVSSFFELTVVWNRGVSYGMLQQSTDMGRWFLIIGSLVAASWMTAIMWRAPDRLTAASLALVVGGALGNAVDRVMYHAVFDFAHLFIGDWSWYVFNIADAAIVVGVIGLLYDAIAEARWKKDGKPV